MEPTAILDTEGVVLFSWLFPFYDGPFTMHIWAEGNTLGEAIFNLTAWMRERPEQEIDGSIGKVVAPTLTWDVASDWNPRDVWTGDVQCTHCGARAGCRALNSLSPEPYLLCDCAEAAEGFDETPSDKYSTPR